MVDKIEQKLEANKIAKITTHDGIEFTILRPTFVKTSKNNLCLMCENGVITPEHAILDNKHYQEKELHIT